MISNRWKLLRNRIGERSYISRDLRTLVKLSIPKISSGVEIPTYRDTNYSTHRS
jgi:hypothetical protein